MRSNPRDIIRRLMSALAVSTQVQLSGRLGIKPQSIISAVKRGEIPEAWLYRVAYSTGKSVEWLRTGRGPAWQAKVVSEPRAPRYGDGRGLADTYSDLMSIWNELDLEERTTVRRCAEALRAGNRDMRELVIREMKLVEEAIQRRSRRKGSRRRSSS